jgi:hypothetical protein
VQDEKFCNGENMEMKSKLRDILLVAVDSFLLFAIVAVLPFAWMLRDGLGPDSVSTSGLAALSRTFMTLYVGPAILLLASFDLLIRSRSRRHNSIFLRKTSIILVIIMLMLIALGAVSFRLVSGR